MKICYETVKPWKTTLDYYDKVNEVLEDLFVKQGFRLTVRQLFYQLVAKGHLKNNLHDYGMLTSKVRNGRMQGRIDWDAIEDRLREFKLPYYVTGLAGALRDTISQYRLDRQEGQPYHVEIWAEKDAVAQIIESVAAKYHIPFLVGRGQFSVSCLKEAADRWNEDGRSVMVLYFGDHDPSGILSIEKNVRETMLTMCPELEQEVIRVAVPLLTAPGSPDILKLLLPNSDPLKPGDVNTPKYRNQFGEESWELEAMTPADLKLLLSEALNEVMDSEVYQNMLDREKEDIKKLKKLVAKERS